MTDPREAGLAAYVAYLETLKPEGLAELGRHCAPDMRFQDPFNAVTGVEGYRAVLAKMFADIELVKFQVHQSLHRDGAASLLWTLTWRSGAGPVRAIEGMSALTLNEAGQITAHINHWDAAGQLYERIPGLGFVLKKIRAKLSV